MKSIFPYFIAFFVILISCNNLEQRERSTPPPNVNIENLLKQADDFYQQNEFKKAIPIFDYIVSLDSTIGKVFYQRAYCKAQLFDYLGSSLDYRKAVELNYRIEDSYFSLGCNYAAIYNDTLALNFFLKAFELNPNNQDAKREVIHFKKRLGIIEI